MEEEEEVEDNESIIREGTTFLHRNLLRRTKLEVETQLTVSDSLVPFCDLRLRLFDFLKFLCATFAASH
jgi:hypothetical protein